VGYVMVPVPEHHEKEFATWLLQQTMRAALATWNPQSLQAAIDRLEGDDRRIVRRVSEAKAFWLDASTVSEDLGIDVAELVTRATALNQECFEHDTPPLFMMKSPEQSRNGRAAFMMDSTIREDVLAALS
jgi:hypothetical protein